MAVCQRSAVASDPYVGPCPACKHPTLLHRNPHNQAIDHCLICELQEAIAELRQVTEEVRSGGGSTK